MGYDNCNVLAWHFLYTMDKVGNRAGIKFRISESCVWSCAKSVLHGICILTTPFRITVLESIDSYCKRFNSGSHEMIRNDINTRECSTVTTAKYNDKCTYQ